MNAGTGPEAQHHAVIVVIAPDERSAEVTIEGRTRVVHGESPRQTRSGALDAAASYAAHLGRPVLVNARDANGSWQLSVSPTGVVQTVGGNDAELGASREKKSASGKGRKILIGTASAVLVLGVLGGAGYFALGLLPDGGTSGASSDAETPIPFDALPVPPGFAAEAAWSHPMAPGLDPTVAPDGGSAAFVSEGEELTLIGPDGAVRWAEKLPVPADEVQNGPYFVVDGDGYGVALLGKGRMWRWSAEGGEPVETEVPEGGRVSFAGGAPLVEGGDGDAFVTASGGGLEQIEVPDSGYGAMLYDGEQVLSAVLSGPWQWARPDGGGVKEVEPDEPKGGDEIDRLLTARAEHVVLLWTAKRGDDAIVAVHDSRDGSVVAHASVDPDELSEAHWEQGGDVAAYGPVVFDLAAGEATVTGLVPESASDGRVFGEIDGGAVAVDGTGEATEIDPDTARPWGLLDGRAVVAAGETLYGLSPE
ncbi:flagellar basal body-associated FliL family protein [Nocardiopsis potens]|uniref:hypothetical protein n=1 Tax=Nocardiopsis potens TaxID=1246458 RepID=UPI000345ADEE|nr:hypothetical protein [Nocardiopsis potens]